MVMSQNEYRVELDVYNGPLELLLYLIKKEEVDIHNIPISHITSQYLAHVEMIRRIDINLAGDFLVMAATLMEIKSRMLAPRPEAQADGTDTSRVEDFMDPRKDLVEQLLAYKRFKDAAETLRRHGDTEAMRFPRAVRHSTGHAPLEIEDLDLFALIDAFNAIMASIGHSAYEHEVIYDDTPISLHQADILDRLTREGPLTLQAMFVGRKSRSEMIGLFLAMLELIRLRQLAVEQPEPGADILLTLVDPAHQALNGQEPANAAPTPAAPAAPEPPAAPESLADTTEALAEPGYCHSPTEGTTAAGHNGATDDTMPP